MAGLIDEVYRHYWHYYKRKATPKVDIRLVILATLLTVSAIQVCLLLALPCPGWDGAVVEYLSAVQKHREAIHYALTQPKFRHAANQIAKDRGLIGEARKKEYRKLKRTKVNQAFLPSYCFGKGDGRC